MKHESDADSVGILYIATGHKYASEQSIPPPLLKGSSRDTIRLCHFPPVPHRCHQISRCELNVKSTFANELAKRCQTK
jgi:hypothetical protein